MQINQIPATDLPYCDEQITEHRGDETETNQLTQSFHDCGEAGRGVSRSLRNPRSF